MRYAYYISGRAQRFSKFISAIKDEKNKLQKICLVISDVEISVSLKNILEINQIPFVFIEYKALGKNNKERNKSLSDRILELLSAHNIDYMFSFGRHILAGDLLEQYRWRLINFHPALLPMYPGERSIDQAVAHGNTLLVGNTVHFIDEGIDTGQIIMQSVVPLQVFWDSGLDYDSVLDLQIDMLKILIYLLEENRIKVENGRVRIQGADYTKSMLFPYIDGVDTSF